MYISCFCQFSSLLQGIYLSGGQAISTRKAEGKQLVLRSGRSTLSENHSIEIYNGELDMESLLPRLSYHSIATPKICAQNSMG